MAEQQIALYSGPQPLNLPKAGGSRPRSSGTSSGEKGALTMSGFFENLNPDSKLPKEVDAFKQNTQAYYQAKEYADNLRNSFMVQNLSVAMSYGGDTQGFIENYADELSRQTVIMNQADNYALELKSLGEQDKKAFLASPLSKMETGTLLRNNDGYLMRFDEVLNEEGKLRFFKNNPQLAQQKYGILDKEGKPFYSNEEFKKDLTVIELNKMIKGDWAWQPAYVTKEDRIALQDYMPIANGWDDVTSIDDAAFYDQMKAGVSGLGSFDDSRQEADTAEVALFMEQVFTTGYKTNPNVRKWINKASEEKAMEESEALRQLTLAGKADILISSFSLLREANAAIGGKGFANYLLDPETAIQKINDSGLSDEKKTEITELLQNHNLVRMSLLNQDRGGDIIPERYLSAMYRDAVKKDLIQMYDTEKLTPEEVDEAKITKRNADDAKNRVYNYPKRSTYTKTYQSDSDISDIFNDDSQLVKGRSALGMVLNGDWDKSIMPEVSDLSAYPEALVANINKIGGKEAIPLYDFGWDKKFTPKANYPGGYELRAGNEQIYDPVSGNLIPIPFSGIVLEETMFTDELRHFDKKDSSIDPNIYVATKIALTKEEMANYQVNRSGGSPLMAEDLFATDKNSIFELNYNNHDAAARKWMEWYGGNNAGLTEKEVAALAKERYMVTVFVAWNNNEYWDQLKQVAGIKVKPEPVIEKDAAQSQLEPIN